MAVSTVRASIGATPYTVELSDNHGHRWLGDEPVDLGGANAGPAPEQQLLASLGTCTAVTLMMYARRKQWLLTQVHVDLAFNPQGKPPSGSDIHRSIQLVGNWMRRSARG
jgi:putative redox protein